MGNRADDDAKRPVTDNGPVPTEQDKALAQSFLKESDRGCVIFGAAWLDERLECLFRSFCRQDMSTVRGLVDPLFRGYGPLGSFSAKIQLAYALYLIPRDLRNQLELIRRLRNEFAHEWGPIDFDDPRVSGRLHALIGKPGPEEVVAADTQHRLGNQLLNQEQMIRRLAFAFRVVRLGGRLWFLEESIQLGRDVRMLNRVSEQQDRRVP